MRGGIIFIDRSPHPLSSRSTPTYTKKAALSQNTYFIPVFKKVYNRLTYLLNPAIYKFKEMSSCIKLYAYYYYTAV